MHLQIESPTLLLFPTLFEGRLLLENEVVERIGTEPIVALDRTGSVFLACSGFGAVTGGIGAAHAIAEVRRLTGNNPAQVVLIGIAGTYDEQQHPPGSIVQGEWTVIDGIGKGTGEDFLSAAALGFSQQLPFVTAAADQSAQPHLKGTVAVCEDWDQVLPLKQAVAGGTASPVGILSVTAASMVEHEVQRRRLRFATCQIEDMESYSVAMACQAFGVPCSVVRGISNTVGVHDKTRWQTAATGQRLRKLFAPLLTAG